MAFQGAPDSWEIFSAIRMFTILEELGHIRTRLTLEEDPRAIAVAQMIVSINADLVKLSETISRLADSAARARLSSTQRRPDSTRPVHLRDAIHSRPLPFGGVALYLIKELDKAVNPETGGTYWLTQELGSRETGNEMTGRILFGTFEGPGHDERPMSEYRGAAGAPGAQFLFGGVGAGFGTIAHEIEGRHYLRDGAKEAWEAYLAGIATISDRYAAEIAGLLA